MKTRLFLASALVLSLAATACGGEKKPAESPESTAGITETSAQEDMPPPPAKEGDAPATPAAEGEAAGAAGGVIKLAAMKIVPVKKGGKDKPIELKEDGTVSIDGKPAATIKGDSVDSSGGTSMVTVGVDGSLVGNGVSPGYKFEGDELVHENGTKLSVDDEGTISLTKDGKTEPFAKAEGGASAKRAALIAAVLWMTVPAKTTAAKPKK
ncbi:MAG: hypothetical protein KIS78_32295 [Labilithrix sp.]|nr:hypothetical protein [Labilithrix sp.]MCW5837120.1 hypothetical protein [Labilithrix sp.]